MSEVSKLIFHGEKHWLSSPFGYREPFSTAGGKTSSFHSGADYSTNRKKLAQYAVESGTVLSCGRDWAYGGAKYVWVGYPRLGVKMLHYHLDRIKVKKGQAVNNSTVLGYTGMTGKATGIHLHLGLKKLSGGDWLDPEKWSEENFRTKASGKAEAYSPGNYRVSRADVLNVRKGASTGFERISFQGLSADAQKKVLRLAGYRANGYVRGLEFTVFETSGNWGRTPSGWVCLDYCERV